MKIKIEENKAIGYLQYPFSLIAKAKKIYNAFDITDYLTDCFHVDWAEWIDWDIDTVTICLYGSITTMMYIRNWLECQFGLIDIMK